MEKKYVLSVEKMQELRRIVAKNDKEEISRYLDILCDETYTEEE